MTTLSGAGVRMEGLFFKKERMVEGGDLECRWVKPWKPLGMWGMQKKHW